MSFSALRSGNAMPMLEWFSMCVFLCRLQAPASVPSNQIDNGRGHGPGTSNFERGGR